MNKKSLITMLVALCLVAAVGVGATLAYFTDSDEKTNVVTMGKVDIELTEDSQANTEKGITAGTYNEETQGYDYAALVPGQTVSKIVGVSVDKDSNPCYIRVKVQSDVDILDLNTNYTTFAEEGQMWWYNADEKCFYYSRALNGGESIQLFNTLTIPAEWDNAKASTGFSIVLQAEAIQADYLGDDVIGRWGDIITTWNLTNRNLDPKNIEIKKYNAPIAVVADEPATEPIG